MHDLVGVQAIWELEGVHTSEKTNTSYNTGPDMVPAKGSLINLGESKTTALVWIGNVSIVVVKIVKGSVASRCMGGHDRRLEPTGWSIECMNDGRLQSSLSNSLKERKKQGEQIFEALDSL
jgi:hypothetical protein